MCVTKVQNSFQLSMLFVTFFVREPQKHNIDPMKSIRVVSACKNCLAAGKPVPGSHYALCIAH